MSDLFGNHIVGLSMRWLNSSKYVLFLFQAIHLIKAVSLLLRFTPDEQKLMKDTLEWKMSWFGGSQPPAVLKGQANKIIPPPY